MAVSYLNLYQRCEYPSAYGAQKLARPEYCHPWTYEYCLAGLRLWSEASTSRSANASEFPLQESVLMNSDSHFLDSSDVQPFFQTCI